MPKKLIGQTVNRLDVWEIIVQAIFGGDLEPGKAWLTASQNKAMVSAFKIST